MASKGEDAAKTAAKVLGVIAVALVLFAVGKHYIDKSLDDDERKRLEGQEAIDNAKRLSGTER